jgi:hypothetical protein
VAEADGDALLHRAKADLLISQKYTVINKNKHLCMVTESPTRRRQKV